MTDKRPAYEPPSRLLSPTGYNPQMRRPVTTVAGATLVLLRALAGVLWLVALVIQSPALARDAGLFLNGANLDRGFVGTGLVLVVVTGGIVLAGEALLAFLIFRGLNWPRVVVMLFSVASISTAFVAWWAQGLKIDIQTTLLTLSLDILVLLALSSRSAAAYARRNERSPERTHR